MAKFRFGLEKVLNYRETLKTLAERDLQAGEAYLSEEISSLEQMQAKRHEAFESRYQRQVQGGVLSEALTQVHEFIKGQDLRIETQRKKIQEIEKQVEVLREALRQRAVDTKIMEGLRDRKRREFVTEQNKIEQKRADDLTSTRFGKRNRGE